tara:strand:+ start:165 stop:521 length:357 start_codon:yes stop_codon:yes gene_type:complete
MEKYIAVVRHEGNKVTKHQDFSSKSDADAHVVKYGGFVADKPDSDRMSYWVVDGEKLTFDKSTADSDEAAMIATQYQRDRVYPDIGDQLDMQYHDLVDDTTTWKDAIAKVKSDHPKPE